MIDYGRVRGNDKPEPIHITDSKVFIASNIDKYNDFIDEYSIEGYEYDYKCYDKDEYIQKIGTEYEDLQSQLLNTQMALCDIYESIGGQDNG
jgi:hypothetical protein